MKNIGLALLTLGLALSVSVPSFALQRSERLVPPLQAIGRVISPKGTTGKRVIPSGDGTMAPVVAPANGTIEKVGMAICHGHDLYHTLRIRLADGQTVELKHFTASISPTVGQAVRRGDIIGYLPKRKVHDSYIAVQTGDGDYGWLYAAVQNIRNDAVDLPVNDVVAESIPAPATPPLAATVQRSERHPAPSAVEPPPPARTPSPLEVKVCGKEGCVFPLEVRPPLRPSQRWHASRHATKKKTRVHYATDYDAPLGAPIASPAAGVVRAILLWKDKDAFQFWLGRNITVKQRPHERGGQYVAIDHGNGCTTWVMHLNSIEVFPGRYVEAGEKIGEVGQTSVKHCGPHAHIQITCRNGRVNPERVFAKAPIVPIKRRQPVAPPSQVRELSVCIEMMSLPETEPEDHPIASFEQAGEVDKFSLSLVDNNHGG